MKQWPLAAAILCLVGSVVGQAPRNVSVDDQDSSITYEPSKTSWTLTAPGDWDAGPGKAHMLSSDADAFATFTFTGVAFYYWAANWPYPVFSTVTVDDDSPVLVNLTDPSPPATTGLPPTKVSSVMFSATGLSNTTHTIRVSIGTAPTGNYAIVDLFTYTTLTPATKSSSAGTASPTQSNDGSSSSKKGLSTAVKVGIAVAIIGLLLLLLVLFLILRWLKRRRAEDERSMVAGSYGSPDPNTGGFGMRQANSPVPTGTNPIWSDPDYIEATRRMNVPPVGFPYNQNASRSSVRLVPPENDSRMISDGSNYSTSTYQPPLQPGADIQTPHHPYSQSAPQAPYNSNYDYNGYGQR